MRILLTICLFGVLSLSNLRGGLALQSDRLIVLGGTLIDGTGAPPIRNSLIVIDNGVITYAGKREDRFLSKPRSRIIDASNKWIIPGLTDMHVHYEEWMGKLFLANGVTTIKDTGNDPDWIVKERDRINSSSMVAAPRIIACGPVLDGLDSIWKMFSSHIAKADDQQGVQKVVAELVEKKVDCLKTYINLPEPAMKALINAARDHGLPVTSHLGVVDARRAANLGINEIEHASGIAEAALSDLAVAKATSMRNKHNSPTGENWPVQPWEFTTKKRLRSLIQLLLESNVAIDPTLIVYDRISRLNDPLRNEDPNLNYVRLSPELKHLWTPNNYFEVFGTRPWTTADYVRARRQQQARMEFIREFANSGGLVVAGSDTPNPYVVPGFSLHSELELLVKAGLSPMRAIQAATLSAATVLRKKQELGTVSAGKIGDLVVVDGDPLTDIRKTKSIHLVIKAGVVFDPKKLLSEVTQAPRQ